MNFGEHEKYEIDEEDEFIFIKKDSVKRIKKDLSKQIDSVLLEAVGEKSFKKYRDRALDLRLGEEK